MHGIAGYCAQPAALATTCLPSIASELLWLIGQQFVSLLISQFYHFGDVQCWILVIQVTQCHTNGTVQQILLAFHGGSILYRLRDIGNWSENANSNPPRLFTISCYPDVSYQNEIAHRVGLSTKYVVHLWRHNMSAWTGILRYLVPLVWMTSLLPVSRGRLYFPNSLQLNKATMIGWLVGV